MVAPEGGTPAPERVELTQPADLPSVELLLAENAARRWEVLHQTYTVATILSIERPAGWTYRGRVFSHDSEGIMLMEPGEFHANTQVTDPASFRVLFMAPALVLQAARELGVASSPHLRYAHVDGRRDPLLRRAFVGLHSSLERRSTPLERQSRFATCLRLLLERCAEATPPPIDAARDPEAVRRAKEYIAEHLAENVGLQQLVEAVASPSQFHLIRGFSRAVGLPPHAYQIQLRIAKAKALVAAGVRPADVALEVGFYDQSHLSRHFVRAVGVTPSAYSKAMAGMRPAHFALTEHAISS